MERHPDMQAPVPLPVNVDTTGAKILEDDASHPDQRDSRDIYLPNHVESVSHIAVDIGGSLAKVVYFTRSRSSSDPPPARRRSVTPPNRNGSGNDGEDIGAGASLSASPSSRSSPSPPSVASPLSPPSTSRLHSRQSSVNGVGAHPLPPRSPIGSSDMSASTSSIASSHPTPSGTLTPTAILSHQEGYNPARLNSAVNAMRSSLLKRRSLPPTLPGGRLNFVKFETSDIESCIAFLKELIESSARANSVTIEEMRKGVKVMATGGGAHMFYEVFERELGVEVQKEDEMGCLITGLNFITLIPDEVFWYSDELVSALHSPLPHSEASSSASPSSSSPPPADQLPRPSPNPPLYAPMFDSNPIPKLPCLLVNIGSGVSIIKVDDYGKFERVSGTSLGGGTLWGLLSLLTDADSFDEMLELSERGDNSTVDMLVSDIYGQSSVLNAFGLKSSTIASSFGKVFRKNTGGGGASSDRKKKFRPEDICKSLLYAVSNNIGQIAHMTAEKYDLDRIYFGGCFIRGHQATISTLSYAIRFWSKGTKRAFFLRHEGYLGAIGAWIKHLGEEGGGGNGGVAATAAAVAAAAAAPANQTRAKGAATAPTAATSSSPVVNGDDAHARDSATPSISASPAPVSVGDVAAESLSVAGPAHPTSSTTIAAPQLPARTLAASQDLPPPIAEAPEAAVAAAAAAAPTTTAASAKPNGVATTPTPTATRNTDDLLSMLNELQVDHRQLVEPVVNAQRAVESSGQDAEVAAADTDADADVAQLLAQLEAADGAADGLESRLDNLLSKLDGLLEGSGAEEEAMSVLNALNNNGGGSSMPGR